MADLTITKANVIPGANATIKTGTAGGTVTTGQTIYEDTTDGNSLKACDADVLASAACKGIAVADALDGQPLPYVSAGDLAFGAILTAGQIYVVSTTAGGIAPYADLASGDYVTILGVASSTSNLAISLNVSGTAKG